jgi:hypothetical protein
VSRVRQWRGQWREWLADRRGRAPLYTLLSVTVLFAALAGMVTFGGKLPPIVGHGGDALEVAFATPTPAPPLPPIPYAHSWYIDNPDNVSAMGSGDAAWLTQESATFGCRTDFLTVLDFGHPTRKYTGHASPLDDYAMSLFGHHDDWRTYREVEQLAERYLDAWMGNVSACPQLHLALGASNYNECGKAVGACDVGVAGQYWDIVIHDVTAYVAAKGYDKQVIAVWLGDDIEGSWDPWPTTQRFLEGARNQERAYTTHARLVDYGDADFGACSEVTQDCSNPWSLQNIYDAAWGVGWNVPLPEAYTYETTQRWQQVQTIVGAANPMYFAGVMTECAGIDPLPTATCDVSPVGQAGSPQCEWSPALAQHRVQAADSRQQLAYATNIQWFDQHQDDPKHTRCH